MKTLNTLAGTLVLSTLLCSGLNHELKQMSTYLDNVLVESNTKSFSESTANNLDILIGKRPITDLYYSGNFDDLYFYDRAISEAEIATLYQIL